MWNVKIDLTVRVPFCSGKNKNKIEKKKKKKQRYKS